MRIRFLAVAALVCGCSQLAPFQSTPREALPGPEARLPRVGVCYNALFATPEDVREMAIEACSGIGAPRLVEQDMRFTCPLLVPVRATFACVPADEGR